MSSDLLDPNQIPADRVLAAAGIGAYVTPALVSEFHSETEAAEFNHHMRRLPFTVDPEGEMAVSHTDYVQWLGDRLR